MEAAQEGPGQLKVTSSSPERELSQQSSQDISKDTDCLRDAGVQAVNDLLQLFLHAWGLEQVLLPKTAQGQRVTFLTKAEACNDGWGKLIPPARASSLELISRSPSSPEEPPSPGGRHA